MRPKTAILRRVRIPLLSVYFGDALRLRGDQKSSALECERAAGRQEILKPFRPSL